MMDLRRLRQLAPATLLGLLISACAGDPVTTSSASPDASTAPTTEPTTSVEATPADASEAAATTTPEPTVEAEAPSEPGETAWYELVLQGTGELTGGEEDSGDGFHEGHVLRAGTLDVGPTVRLELPEDHAFADGPRSGHVLVGSDDGAASELLLVDTATGEAQPVISSDEIIWGGSLSPDATAVYYVPVDRASMTDAGLWRLALRPEAEPERLIEQLTPATYDFASQYHVAWTPDGKQLVMQYCNRGDCLAHIVDAAGGESQLHDAPRIFQLRGATDTEYVADAISGDQRSGLLAIDLETQEVRVLAEEWGVSEVHQTDGGPLVVYFAPDQAPRDVALIGLWLDREADPFTVYEDRTGDLPLAPEFNPRGTGYEAPEGQILMWPGSPGPEPRDSEPEFTLLDILSGEELTFPYDIAPPS